MILMFSRTTLKCGLVLAVWEAKNDSNDEACSVSHRPATMDPRLACPSCESVNPNDTNDVTTTLNH